MPMFLLWGGVSGDNEVLYSVRDVIERCLFRGAFSEKTLKANAHSLCTLKAQRISSERVVGISMCVILRGAIFQSFLSVSR